MRRRSNKRSAKQTKIPNRLSRLETLTPRLVLSGMVMDAPMQTEPVVERAVPGLEINRAKQFTRDLRELDVASLPEGVRPTEPCPYDLTLQIRQANEREGTVRVPQAAEGVPLSESDIPDEMRNTDELFGDRDFWIQGSRPLDQVSQQVSGPGTEQYPDLGPPLAFDPASLLAPSPLGGVPESNLDSILSQIPSLSDVAHDGDGGLWEWLKSLFSDDDETSETPSNPCTPETPNDNWKDISAPPMSHPVVQIQAKVWNEGMRETSNGLSSLTTHLEKRGN